MISDYHICTRYLMDTIYSKIILDEKGVCNHWHDYDRLVTQKVLEGNAGRKQLECPGLKDET